VRAGEGVCSLMCFWLSMAVATMRGAISGVVSFRCFWSYFSALDFNVLQVRVSFCALDCASRAGLRMAVF
jgi:hypothetical protein